MSSKGGLDVKAFVDFIKVKSGIMIGLAVASLMGGLVSAAALASIPDSGGTIHGCYRSNGLMPNGSLRVIDNSSSACNANETSLNWKQNGGSDAPVVHDANGQVLGVLVDHGLSGGSGDPTMKVYNDTLKRVIPIFQNLNQQLTMGTEFAPFFQTTDCTGQAYMYEQSGMAAKLTIYGWGVPSSRVYATLGDNTASTSVRFQSYLHVVSDGSYVCDLLDTGETVSAYPFTVVSLPFSTPVAAPFKF